MKIAFVVPYIGTWIETERYFTTIRQMSVVPYIGTWIETMIGANAQRRANSRTLYRYVD